MTTMPTARLVGVWMALTLSAFVALAGLVAAGFEPIVEADESITRWLFEARSEWLTDAFEVITLAGSRWVIGAFLAALSVWVVRSGRCRWALGVLLAAFVINPLLETVLKGVVDRPRPLAYAVTTDQGAAFPSGHVLAAVGFYGVLAALLWKSTSLRRIRRIGAAVGGVIIGLVAISRLYLGAHWMTDVLGGLLIGSVYLAAVVWAFGDHHLGPSHICLRSRRTNVAAEAP